jgi:hypothetical protein
MPQDMRGDLEVLVRREMGVGLPGDAPQDEERLGAVSRLPVRVVKGGPETRRARRAIR